MRELARSIARANMQKAGFQHINRKIRGTDETPFSRNWRKYVKWMPHTIIVKHHKERKHWWPSKKRREA